MDVIDCEELLSALAEEVPCGPDLEYDAAFIELEQVAQGKAEQQVGDTVTPAEEPDWRDVRRRSLELCERTRDLRVWLPLSRALLHTDGLNGLHDGLRLILGGIERYWDQVHPQLDPDDDNDPTLRVNVLMSLADADTMLRDVRHAPLVVSAALGRFSLREVDIADGKLTPVEGGETVERTTIDAAFHDVGTDALRATLEAAAGSLECLRALETAVTEQVGVEAAPNFAPLAALLGEIVRVVKEQLALHGDGESADANSEDIDAAMPETGAAPSRPRGGIHSGDDVIRVLDEACEYFRRHEPSSPVPILLNRAKRLIHKDFMEILQDLAPDGLSQAEMFKGSDEAED